MITCSRTAFRISDMMGERIVALPFSDFCDPAVGECDIMHNSALIDIHMTHAAAQLGIPRYFFFWAKAYICHVTMLPMQTKGPVDSAGPS